MNTAEMDQIGRLSESSGKFFYYNRKKKTCLYKSTYNSTSQTNLFLNHNEHRYKL
jgi:hypothetical protein